MPGHWMSPRDTGKLLMAADAKFVDRFEKHVNVIGGMGIMTGGTTFSRDNTMDIWYRFVLIQQFLFIIVAGDTNLICAFCPEQVFVFVPVGVMTESAAPY